jgi:hypothetical protein
MMPPNKRTTQVTPEVAITLIDQPVEQLAEQNDEFSGLSEKTIAEIKEGRKSLARIAAASIVSAVTPQE